jgi:putative ABC transport system permease protein
VDGRATAVEGERPSAVDFQSATPGYFDVMGMRVVRGRGLAETDAGGAPHVVVVNESAARVVWPEVESPVGRRLTLDPYGAGLPRPEEGLSPPPAGPQIIEFTVVGVVADVRSSGIHTRARSEVYVSYWQVPWPDLALVVHAPGGGSVGGEVNGGEAMRSAARALAPQAPVDDVVAIEAVAGQAVAQPRYETTLMTIFGALAVLLAVIGCYGVMAHAVQQRTREIGIRMALGATRRTVANAVLGRGAGIVAVGVGVGTLLALAVTRVLESSLYGVSATDPATFALSAALLALVTLAATWLPARRAARVDPNLTLREE